MPANPWVVLRKGDAAPDVLFGISPEAYNVLTLDLARIAAWIKSANGVIDYYEAQE